ncbi:hypothetical protein DSECCO2_345360 [anaerobic digester metagenome]
MVLIGFCVVLTASSVSAASTVYVNATGGSDSNIGTMDHPYQTISQGISSVDENGTVHIADGVYSGEGNTNITISKNVNITGQSQEGTIINGTGTNWIFHINHGFTVMIQNLTITNGKSSNDGGAIYTVGTSTVVNSTFIGNAANGYGGAISNYNGAILTVAGCTFTNNRAQAGGAIFNWDTIHDVTGCTFTGNTAVIAGGAICNVFGTTNNVTGCTFTNNTVTGTRYGGGALYSFGEGFGGSINNVTGCTFTGNNATRGGGAIYNDLGSSMVIHFNSFVGNTANLQGNAIYNSGDSVNATDNWWGSNNPVWTNLIAGMSYPTQWLYMLMDITPTTINNTQTSLVTVSFNNLCDGTTFDPSTGHIPDGTIVNLSSALGSFNPAIIKTIDGIATALFTANQTGTNKNITATTDNQTFTQLLTVNPAAYLYLNVTSSKSNPNVGDTFLLTYKLSNSGPDNATNVTVSFQIPAGLEFVSASVDNGTYTYNPANRTVTWTLDNVAVGDPYLYLTVRALGTGSYSITPAITSETYNHNTDPLMPFSISVQTQNSNNSGSTANSATVNAASTTKTVPMQTTGMPIAELVLAILAVLGGVFTPRKK